MEEARKEFWRWPESRWTNPEIEPQKGKVITCGVDVGSVSSQCVIMVDGELYCYGNMRTGSSSPESAPHAFNKATEGTGLTLHDVHYTVGTGYGCVNVPFDAQIAGAIGAALFGISFLEKIGK